MLFSPLYRTLGLVNEPVLFSSAQIDIISSPLTEIAHTATQFIKSLKS